MQEPDFKLLFEASPDKYLILAPDLTIIGVTEAYLRATLTERAAIVGRHLFDVFPDNPNEQDATGTDNLGASLARVLARKLPDAMAIQKYDIERPPEQGGGFEERYWSPINTPLLDAGGEVSCIIHRVEDVTEFVRLKHAANGHASLSQRERMEADALNRAQDVQSANRQLDAIRTALEDRHRQIMERALDGFLTVSDSGLVRDANPAAEKIFGVAAGGLKGRQIDNLIPASRRAGAPIIETVEHGQPLRVAIGDNPRRHLEVLFSSRTPQGDEEIVTLRLHDETDRILLEDQLRQAQKLEAVGKLTGGLAHDFNNLLTVITSTIDILREGVADRPKLAMLAGAIDEAAERGAQLTQRLLAFSRQQPLKPSAVDVNALVDRSAAMLRRTLGDAITVEAAVARDAWPALVDPGQVEDALLNLAINARDAMPGGGRIIIETRNVTLDEDYAAANLDVAPGDYLALIMTDNGQGMTPAVLERVFEPFFTTKDVGRGSGLGLSMVYGFIKQSRGHIKIYREVGIGTSVKLYLPRTGKSVEVAAPVRGAPLAAGGRRAVLVVEDNEAVRTATSDIVQSLGYTVRVAADGVEALAILGAEPVDILFTDIMMPSGLSGLELMKLAREVKPDLRVLLTSGYTERFMGGDTMEDLGAPLLTKPYRRQQLAEALRDALVE